VNCIPIIIEGAKYARLVVSHIRPQLLESAFCYKEGPFHRAVITPKANGTSGWIKNSALVREIEHCLLVTLPVSTYSLRALTPQSRYRGPARIQQRTYAPAEYNTNTSLAHIGIERFGACHAEKHPAKHQEAFCASVCHILDAIERIYRGHYAEMLRYSVHAERRHDSEPREHYRTERSSDFASAQRLHCEKRKQDND
jgi:hypothetical protein